MPYTYQEVFNSTRDYFNGDEFATGIFMHKYALQNDGVYYEKTPDDMHRRVAKEFARIEAKKFKNPLTEDAIYKLFYRFKKLIPQGSPLFGIGNPFQITSLSNCFVVESPADSYGGICKTDQEIVQISKRRGGIGYDISNLRPEGIDVQNAAKTTTGAISFMPRFSHSGREVGQEGRRAAQMISISVHHPDIEKFIAIKADGTSVTGANISVRLSNEFLNAVKTDKDFELRWPVASKTPKISKMVSAKALWKKIIHYAWLRAEPGLLFWDHILKECPANYYPFFLIISTNPCGEITLSAYDSCRLLAINLCGYLRNPFTKKASFDYREFYKDAKIAQRLMDDLVDLELECIDKIIKKIEDDPEPDDVKFTELNLWKKIREACVRGRRTGLGITGLGDVIAGLNQKYGSDESINTTQFIYQFLKFASYESSMEMAKELGPFPDWDWNLEKDCPFIQRIEKEEVGVLDNDGAFEIKGKDLYENIKKYGRRNIANLTTAPTGTISILADFGGYNNITSGIEPCYEPSYTRRKKGNPNDKDFRTDFVDPSGDHWQEFEIFHNGVKLWMEVTGETDIKKSPYWGASANVLPWIQRVKLQATAQRHVDHSISSTINLPENVKEEEVAAIYETAWEWECKGVTVYRDKCRTGVLIENKKVEEKKNEVIVKSNAPKRPKSLKADVFTAKIQGKEYFVVVGLLNQDPYEVFVGLNNKLKIDLSEGILRKLTRGKYQLLDVNGNEICNNVCDFLTEDEEVLTRLVSTNLRHGCDISFLVHQLEKTSGDLTKSAKILARILKKYIPDNTKVTGENCPNCSSELIRQEGCVSCRNCHFSKCG